MATPSRRGPGDCGTWGTSQLVARQELQQIGISAPTGLCVSSHDPSKLYLASSQNEPNANSVKLYVLSSQDLSLSQTIEIHNMGHITDIAEGPATGTICVVGFIMPEIPSESQLQDVVTSRKMEPFYKARLASIAQDNPGPVDAICPADASGSSDMALPLSIIYVGETTGSRNEGQ